MFFVASVAIVLSLSLGCKKESPSSVDNHDCAEQLFDNNSFRSSKGEFSYTFTDTDYSNELFYERSGQLLGEFFKDVVKKKNEIFLETGQELFVDYKFVFDPLTHTIRIDDVAYIKDFWEYMDVWEKDEQKPQEYHVHCGGGTMDGKSMEVNDVWPGTIRRAVGFVVGCIEAGETVTISKLVDNSPKPPIHTVNMMIVFSDNYTEWETDNFDFKTFLFGEL